MATGRALALSHPETPAEWPLIGLGAVLIVVAFVVCFSRCSRSRGTKVAKPEIHQAEEGELVQDHGNTITKTQIAPPPYVQ